MCMSVYVCRYTEREWDIDLWPYICIYSGYTYTTHRMREKAYMRRKAKYLHYLMTLWPLFFSPNFGFLDRVALSSVLQLQMECENFYKHWKGILLFVPFRVMFIRSHITENFMSHERAVQVRGLQLLAEHWKHWKWRRIKGEKVSVPYMSNRNVIPGTLITMRKTIFHIRIYEENTY